MKEALLAIALDVGIIRKPAIVQTGWKKRGKAAAPNPDDLKP